MRENRGVEPARSSTTETKIRRDLTAPRPGNLSLGPRNSQPGIPEHDEVGSGPGGGDTAHERDAKGPRQRARRLRVCSHASDGDTHASWWPHLARQLETERPWRRALFSEHAMPAMSLVGMIDGRAGMGDLTAFCEQTS